MLHRNVPYSFLLLLLLNYSFPMDSNAQCFIYFIKKNEIKKSLCLPEENQDRRSHI